MVVSLGLLVKLGLHLVIKVKEQKLSFASRLIAVILNMILKCLKELSSESEGRRLDHRTLK